MIEESSPDAANILMKLSDLMRYSLYESNREKIALAKELKFMEDYIALEKIRLPQRANVSYHVSGNSVGILIPPLILLTFVENAFKHGIHATAGEAWLKIAIEIEQNQLSFKAENNIGKKVISLNQAGGIGLQNTQKRLQYYYPEKYHLRIDHTSEIYTVNLKIHFDENESNT